MHGFVRLMLVVVLVAAGGNARAGERAALVFSAEKYEFLRRLDNPDSDGRAVADVLEKLGFEVTVESDRNLKKMRRALDDFREEASGSEVALVFFAGHGVEIGGENRLLPVDADATSVDSLKETSLPLEEVRAALNAVAPVALIVLDACRDDPFGGGEGGGRSAKAVSDTVRAAVKPGLGRIGKAENTLIAFSAAPGETASDGADGHSPFAAALSHYLPTDGLEIRSVLTLVQQEVYDRSGGRQLPYVESGLPQLFFAAIKGALDERERLLMAMADVTPDLRTEVEALAVKNAMPLAPLYAALIGADLKALSRDERSHRLAEAAASFVKTRDDLKMLSADDPDVARLREQAQAALDLGTFGEAREKFAAAAAIDAKSRGTLKENFVRRTLSEAATYSLSGGAARAKLDYDGAIASYEKAIALFGEVEADNPPFEDSRTRLFALEAIADMRAATGHSDLALPLYNQLLAATERTSVRFPDNFTMRGNIGVVGGKIGDMLAARGDTVGARAAYEAAFALAGQLAKDDSGNPMWQRDQAIGHTRLGDLDKAAGNLGEALAHYGAARDIAAQLAAAHPGNADYRRDLSVGHERIANALLLKGDADGALAALRESHSIVVALAAADPDNTIYKRDLDVGHIKIGDALQAKGDDAGALTEFEQALEIAKAIAAGDPRASEAQRDVSVADERIAAVERRLGRHDDALMRYHASLDRMSAIAAGDPGNLDYRRFVAATRTSIADTLIEKGDAAGGLAIYREDLKSTEALVAANPQRLEFRHDLMVVRIRLATLGDDPVTNLKAALAIAEAMRTDGTLPPQEATFPEMLREVLKGFGQ